MVICERIGHITLSVIAFQNHKLYNYHKFIILKFVLERNVTMADNNNFMGYVYFENTMCPFICNDGNLTILPPTIEAWHKQRNKIWKKLVELGKSKDTDEHRWISNVEIKGITNFNHNVLFLAYGDESNNNGFIEYKLQRLFAYDEDKINPDNIDGLYLKCSEISEFFNPAAVFNLEVENSDNCFSKFQVSSDKENKRTLGKYTYQDVEIEIIVRSYANLRTFSDTPFTATTELVVLFSKPANLDFIDKVLSDIKRFLIYICNRSNIKIGEIETFRYQDSKRCRRGEIQYYHDSVIPEEDERWKKRMIKYQNLNIDLSSLLQAISNNEMYFQHFSSSISEQYSYEINRVILIFAAFEREFSNVLKDEFKRSENYYRTKKLAIESLLQLQLTSKSKKYIKGFCKIINNSDYTFSERLKQSFVQCSDIISPFVKKEYFDVSNTLFEEISDRINIMRNNFVHGNMGFVFEPINISDLNILQIIIYILRFKKIGLADKKIQKCINDLFSYNFHFDDK